jgi:hypothetical protein
MATLLAKQGEEIRLNQIVNCLKINRTLAKIQSSNNSQQIQKLKEQLKHKSS